MTLRRDLNYLKDIFPFADQPGSLVMDLQPFVILTMSALGWSRMREPPQFFASTGGAGNQINQTNQVPAGKQWVIPFCHAGHDDATSRNIHLGVRGPDDTTIIYLQSTSGSIGSNSFLPNTRTVILPQLCRLLCEIPSITVTAHALLGALYWEIPLGEQIELPA